jgi:hypothetical protein
VHVNPNSGTFIFDSQDSLNPHRFEVAAIDNAGWLDHNPAILDLQTPRVPPPHTQIVSGPGPADTAIVIDHFIDTFLGIEFDFQGYDPNSRTIEYSWVIDRDEWAALSPPQAIPWSPFSQAPKAYVNASSFPDPYSTRSHTIYLRARNEFGTIDTLGYFVNPRIVNGQIVGYDTVFSNRTFNTVYPKWQVAPELYQQRILLINIDYNYGIAFGDSISSWNPSRDSTDLYYSSIMDNLGFAGKYDIMHTGTYSSGTGFPGLGTFANYRCVFLIGDIINYQSVFTQTYANYKVMKDYANVGGRILITSYGLTSPLDLNFKASDFATYIAHCQDNVPALLHNNFIGAGGLKGYPDVHLDPAKLNPAWNGALRYVVGGRPSGFGEQIYTFQDNGLASFAVGPDSIYFGDPLSPFHTVGVRYIGLQYRVIFFAIPLWYCDKPTATLMLQRAFQDLGEL